MLLCDDVSKRIVFEKLPAALSLAAFFVALNLSKQSLVISLSILYTLDEL